MTLQNIQLQNLQCYALRILGTGRWGNVMTRPFIQLKNLQCYTLWVLDIDRWGEVMTGPILQLTKVQYLQNCASLSEYSIWCEDMYWVVSLFIELLHKIGSQPCSFIGSHNVLSGSIRLTENIGIHNEVLIWIIHIGFSMFSGWNLYCL